MGQYLNLNGDVKPWLGIPVTETKHDDVLNIIIDATEQAVINYVETDFTLHVELNEVQDGNFSDTVLPHYTPLVSVQALYFWTETDGSDGTLIDPKDYFVDRDSITLRNYKTPRERGRVRIDYTWGYDGLPNDVKMMMLQTVEAEFRRKGNKSLGVGSRSKKDESETYSGDNGAWDAKTGLPMVLVYKLNSYKVFEWPVQPMAQRNW